MKNIIQYHIDGIIKDKASNQIELLGWAFESETKAPVEIILQNDDNCSGFHYRRNPRTDLKSIYNIPYENALGFSIRFAFQRPQGEAVIFLKGKEDSRKIKIDLSKDYYEDELQKKAGFINLTKIRNGIRFYKDNGLKATINKMRGLSYNSASYMEWIKNNEHFEEIDDIAKLKYCPLISIVMPVYNVELKYLKACIDSVIEQSYPNWELCIADDCSSHPEIRPFLENVVANDERIKVVFREKNGHICEASNSALTLATGEYVGLLDNDDMLAPNALYEVALLINQHPDAAFIYSDEDKINAKGKRFDPYFKPDWSPDTFLSQNYICHFTVIKKTLIDQVGGFEKGLEGSQDYDLFLKCTEQTDQIYHIPKILYHWRMIEGSTAENPGAKNYAFTAGQRAIEQTFLRRQIAATVEEGKDTAKGTYLTSYAIKGEPVVSILIPTKDHSDDLKCCIDSIFKTSGYRNFEIIVINNNSAENETKEYFDTLTKQYPDKVRILEMPIPFNYSKLNNEAAKIAKGDYLLLLNNDIEMITEGWMRLMLGYAQQKHIGAVGIKLIYPDQKVQHAGVVLGIRGVAGHGFKNAGKNSTEHFNRLNIAADCSAVTAACLMVEKAKYEQVNGLNEETLKVAFNDVDFCLKLLQADYYNVCLGQIEAYHYESKSRGIENTSGKVMRFQNEINYMIENWGELLKKDPFYNPNLTLDREDYGIRSN